MTRRWPLIPPDPLVDGSPIVPPAPPAQPGAVAIPASSFWLPHQPLLGKIDGVNRTLRVAVPFVSADGVREVVYRNGVRVDLSAYTVSSSRLDGLFDTILFQEAPATGDLLVLDAYVMRN